MNQTVTAVQATDGSLLEGVRETILGAEEVLLCVAFVGQAGVHLIGKELDAVGPRCRLLATTVFGSTDAQALNRVRTAGADLRTHNPSGGSTYHPKLYLGRREGRTSAVVGSANLTRGLVCNVEVGCRITGPSEQPVLRDLWDLAERLWHSPTSVDWIMAESGPTTAETLLPGLGELIDAEVARDPTFRTLGSRPQPNLVCDRSPVGLYVETERSRGAGSGPQEIPAWMFNLAWEYLLTHGELTNAHLLKELRVHRSSAVCAILARLPGVEQEPGPKIRLRWTGRRR